MSGSADPVLESQKYFRKERGAINNIFVLMHVREKKKAGKVYAVFIDLKTAFDNVVRDQIMKGVRKKRNK